MKIYHAVISAIAIVMLLLSCKSDNKQISSEMINFPPSIDGEENAEVPIITFDSTVCHFGRLAIGEKLPHTFRFVNTGKSPLVISQVTPSCGCTTAKDWPDQPIMPGESGTITVEFDSKGFPGKIEKNISVLTNCIPREWNLKLMGEVSGIEVIDPAKSSDIIMEREK